eukprot:8792727-Pyramimonas_sp.AAC.1
MVSRDAVSDQYVHAKRDVIPIEVVALRHTGWTEHGHTLLGVLRMDFGCISGVAWKYFEVDLI